jgi:hypothetical protein
VEDLSSELQYSSSSSTVILSTKRTLILSQAKSKKPSSLSHIIRLLDELYDSYIKDDNRDGSDDDLL